METFKNCKEVKHIMIIIIDYDFLNVSLCDHKSNSKQCFETISNDSYYLLPEKSFQKMPIHYDKHYKLCLKTFNRKLIFIL